MFCVCLLFVLPMYLVLFCISFLYALCNYVLYVFSYVLCMLIVCVMFCMCLLTLFTCLQPIRYPSKDELGKDHCLKILYN